jgi:hypothetical protein
MIEGKILLVRHRRSWENNIKMDLKDGKDSSGSG